jgi:hypothetical protein
MEVSEIWYNLNSYFRDFLRVLDVVDVQTNWMRLS